MILRFHMFKNRLPLMNSALDAYSERQKVHAKNIANVNSPHYRPQQVKFEEFFHEQKIALGGSESQSRHIPLGASSGEFATPERENAPIPSPEVYFSGETHVNVDKEMSEMAQNQIKFRFASQMISKYFRGLTQVISGNISNQ